MFRTYTLGVGITIPYFRKGVWCDVVVLTNRPTMPQDSQSPLSRGKWDGRTHVKYVRILATWEVRKDEQVL